MITNCSMHCKCSMYYYLLSQICYACTDGDADANTATNYLQIKNLFTVQPRTDQDADASTATQNCKYSNTKHTLKHYLQCNHTQTDR